MKKALLLWLFVAMGVVQSLAQTRTINGKILDAKDGTPLPGVTVKVKGTSTGTVSAPNGSFKIDVADGAALVISFVGYEVQEIPTGGRTDVTVQLRPDTRSLQEVIVTAQGIVRDKRSLGYATETVKGADLAQKSEPNVLNTLAGKVAGVNIQSSSGVPGASTNINIRGITSFSGSNQPLIVVDGVIFSNDLDQTQNTLFGSQPSNRLADIAPESIESISILKGPAAAALYGSRASAGAILITTKSGKGLASGKTEVTFTSSVNFSQVSGMPKFQNEYGQGANNDFVNTSSNSWGPKFGTIDSVTTVQGTRVPYKAYPNNVKDFFQTGRIFQNGVNLASGTADNNFTLGLSSTIQKGIVPETEFNRHSVQLGGNRKFQNGIKVGASVTYVRSNQLGIPQGNGGSAFGLLSRIPRSYDLMGMPFQDPITGASYFYNTSQNHPMWSVYNEQFTSKLNRAFGFFTIGYDFTNWLSVSYRVTGDMYNDRRKFVAQPGSARTPEGQILEDQFYRGEFNGDLNIRATKKDLFVPGLELNALLGHNINHRDFQNATINAQSLSVPHFDNVTGGLVFTASTETSNRRRLIGYYGQLSFNYKNYLFLELTGRMDQSSTLPKDNNRYFYPSAALSFVPTDAFKIQSDVLSYLKLRVNAARVGRDADPYLLNNVYSKSTFGNNTASITFPISTPSGLVPGFSPNGRLAPDKLTPEFTYSYEGGFNIGLLKNRVSIDATYFYTRSVNQIFNLAVSNSSGYDTRTANVGLMKNRGIEVLINATPLQFRDFTWDVSLNYTRIRNKVERIGEKVGDIKNTSITGNAFIGIQPSIAEGYAYGVIIGTKNARNEKGELLINPATGLFAPGIAGEVIADPNPDWIAGITNTFRYKNFSLSVLIDTKQGGDIYSFTMADLRGNGSLELTGADRDKPRILPGVIDAGGGKYVPNNIQVSAQSYWAALGGLASEGAVFDATVYRLREISLYYTLPSRWFANTAIGSVSLGASAHNLYFYAPHFPADPEMNTQGAGNIQGLDLNGAPNTRNFGANLRVTF